MKRIRPGHYVCESCPHWDDVNGCWQNCKFFGDSDECSKADLDGESDD